MFVTGALLGLVFLGWALDLMENGDSDCGGTNDDDLLPDPGEQVEGGGDDTNIHQPDGSGQMTGAPAGVWLGGSDGDDHLIGGDGHDDLFGGQGHDTLDGGAGDDWLIGDGDYGVGGDDRLIGGAGNDHLAGNGGDDSLFGGPGNDTLFGGEGDDLLNGGSGNDWLFGGPGNDTLIAGPGDNDLSGNEGDDLLVGFADGGRSWMHGGDGDDTLVLYHNDFGEGGPGADRFILPGDAKTPSGTAPPIIADYDPAEDRIELWLPATAPDPVIALTQNEEGMTVIVVDDVAVARVLGGTVRVESLIISRTDPAWLI